MYAIRARRLERLYPNGRGLRGASLEIAEGECYALLGRNGSGKTTLLRLLLGLEVPTGGELSVLGRSLERGTGPPRRRMAAVLDTSAHWEGLTGRQNAYFAARSYGLPRRAAERRLAELFEPADLSRVVDEPVETFSYGMRRKLSLVQALCPEPELLVLDEPSAGLDAHFQGKLAELIAQRCGKKQTTVVASNDPEWSAAAATRIGLMHAGRVVREGTVDELVAEVSSFREAKIVLTSPLPVGVPELPGLHSLEQNGCEVTALLEPDPAVVPRLVGWLVERGADVQALEVERATLRDAFLAVTGEALRE